MVHRKRQRLTRERVLDTAIDFADAHGVEALTMRRLAGVLGCGVMSLYSHVANKDEMLFEMVDQVVRAIVLPPTGVDWKRALRANAESANAVLLTHPWAAAEWTRRMPGPARTRYMDTLLRVLTEAGLPAPLVYKGYHVLTMHIVGFTEQQIAYRQALAGDTAVLAQTFLDGMTGHYPHLVHHIQEHVDGTHEEDDDEFGFVLELILDGLERAARER